MFSSRQPQDGQTSRSPSNQHLDDLVQDASYTHNTQTPLDEPASEQNLPPLVLVEGFFSFFHEILWGPITKHLNASRHRRGLSDKRRILFARVGPVSSMHDRACELYAVIKGGTVDYGEEHAKQNGHARYGRTFTKGLYTSWSKENPIHFLAHSLGGNTILRLQRLIQAGHFGPDAHPDMISSVSTISTPFHGTSFTYFVGKDFRDPTRTRLFSMDMLIQKSIHMVSYFRPITPSWMPVPDWHGDARNLTFAQISPFGWFKQTFIKSDWGESKDVISYDASFHGAHLLDEDWMRSPHPNPNGYYRSYTACMTERKPNSHYHAASWRSPVSESVFLYYSSGLVGAFDYKSIEPLPEFFRRGTRSVPTTPETLAATRNGYLATPQRTSEHSVRQKTNVSLDEDYYANDGAVPLFSQWHPGECDPDHCLHHSTLRYQPHDSNFNFGKNSRLQSATYLRPRIWNVCHVPDSTHVSIVPLWHEARRQKEFWVEFGEYLEDVDVAQDNRKSMLGMMEFANGSGEHVDAANIKTSDGLQDDPRHRSVSVPVRA